MTSTPRERIWEIANAVLYEGYLLYPYRHSALKNRQRWNFGVVYPREYHEAHASGAPWTMRAECLVEAPPSATLEVTARFLQLLTRSASAPAPAVSQPAAWAPDEWQEGSERELAAPLLSLGQLADQPQRMRIAEPAGRVSEAAPENDMVITREWQALEGVLTLAATPLDMPGAPVYKLTAQIVNTTPLFGQLPDRSDLALLCCFVSTHAILQVSDGAFVSLLDPPERLRGAVEECAQQGVFPVLVGAEGAHDAMLASPIILYDYPQIAPESAGALFDGTEIDEILTLRILALSDDEKEEMRQSGDQSRAILERTEALTAEQLMKLHGAMRSLGPSGGGARLDGQDEGSGV